MFNNLKMTLEPWLDEVISKLERAGFKAYLAGGAVRDLLLGKSRADIDIATSARPDQIKKIFPRTKDFGAQFGSVQIISHDHKIHITTFRREIGFSDQRHPEQVDWSDEKEDALRRDFTVNGLFYDVKEKRVIDYVNGQRDLEAKILRFIGDPDQRIEEDSLRLLRAIRFKNGLDLKYEISTWRAVTKLHDRIANVSSERVTDELDKILSLTQRGQAIEDLSRSGILAVILPEVESLKGVDQSWKFHTEGDVFNHTLLALEALPVGINLETVWSTLLHDIGKPATKASVPDKKWGGERIGFYNHHKIGAELARKLLERLAFSNQRIEKIVWLVYHHMMIHEILEMRPGKQRRWLLDPRLPDLLELHRADASGKEKKIKLNAYHAVSALMKLELAKPPPALKLINGHEIMDQFSLKPGPKIGQLLKIIEEAVWDGTVKTKSEALLLLKSKLKSD